MKTNRWIETSQKFFASLLNLYPRDHRADFAESMKQVFTDQCRDAYREKGIFGIFFLWLRVLPDLGYTAVLEHITSPRAAWGLMEPVPNAPLPWKGVFLILLPDSYTLSARCTTKWRAVVSDRLYRAAFFLILLFWLYGRLPGFPYLGIDSVGLLFRLVKEIGYQLIILHPGTFSSNPALNLILQGARLVENNLWIQVAIFSALSIILALRFARRNKLSRDFWIWSGAFFLLVVLRSGLDILSFFQSLDVLPAGARPQILQDFLQWNIASILYNASALLLLVFLGTLFTPRHGFFSIFILVGYVLPIIVVGTPLTQDDNPTMILFLSIGVLLYRSILSLVAPIWMSRCRTQSRKKSVIVFSIFLALAVHAIMQFYPAFFNLADRINYPNWIQYVASDELSLVFAFLLGMSLYQSVGTAQEDHKVVPDGSQVLDGLKSGIYEQAGAFPPALFFERMFYSKLNISFIPFA